MILQSQVQNRNNLRCFLFSFYYRANNFEEVTVSFKRIRNQSHRAPFPKIHPEGYQFSEMIIAGVWGKLYSQI